MRFLSSSRTLLLTPPSFSLSLSLSFSLSLLLALGLAFSHTPTQMFRFGASSLLGDLERQLHHQATGVYAADYYMPAA